MNDSDDSEESYVVFAGGAVKSMGGSKVGGRILTFGTAYQPDRVGDIADAFTDFWINGQGERKPILYRHGVDPTVKKRRFGEAQITKAADGLWCSGYITGSDDHAQKLIKMAELGELNWSTGSVGHLVERTPVGKAWHLDSWPLSELSLCPKDAVVEPRNILSLKELVMTRDVPDLDSLMAGYRADEHHADLQRRAKAAHQRLLAEHHADLERRAAEIYAGILKSQLDRLSQELR